MSKVGCQSSIGINQSWPGYQSFDLVINTVINNLLVGSFIFIFNELFKLIIASY
jgi:hypothetical protein